MPGQMKINFKNFWGLDISKMVKVKRPGATGGSFQDTLLRGALTAVAPVAKRGALLNDSLNMISSPSGVISLLGSIPGVKFGSPSPDFTIAVGYTASGGAGVTVGGGAGVYFWNKKPSGEVGLYGSFSIGMMTNVGFSLGDQICVLFGPAGSVLAGECITLEVDIEIGVVTVGGQLILNAPPVGYTWPPTVGFGSWTPEVIGIGITLTMGISALPVSVSVMPGKTWIKPLTP